MSGSLRFPPAGKLCRATGILLLLGLGPVDRVDAQAIEVDSPPAPTILPAETIAYLRITDARRMADGLSDTGIGRMLDDPQLQPIRQAWTETLLGQINERLQPIGLDAEQLWQLSRGQIAVAVCEGTPEEPDRPADANSTDQADGEKSGEAAKPPSARQQRRLDNPFAFVAILGVDPAPAAVDEVTGKIDEALRGSGWVVRNVLAGDIEVTRYRRPAGNRTVEWFRRGPTLVIGTGSGSAVAVAQRMASTPDATLVSLSADPGFGAVMTRSVAGEGGLPETTFFVNPVRLARRALARSPVGGFAIPVLEDLGIDQIRGAGGAVFAGDERTESSTHLHVVLDPPRTRLWGVLQPVDVPPVPPGWVPAAAVGFASLQWNAATAYENLITVVESFAGVGQFDTFVANPVTERLGVDLKIDLIDQWTGRYVTAQLNRPGDHRQTLRRVHGFELRDPAAFDAVLQRIDEHVPDGQMKAQSENDVITYLGPVVEPRFGLPQTQPTLARLGDWVIYADQPEVMQMLRDTIAGEAESIGQDLDYELSLAALGEKLNGQKPFWVSYSRDADWYEAIYQSLLKISGDSAYGRTIAANPPPPFESLKHYFGVSGSVGIDTDDGLQWIGATLRP